MIESWFTKEIGIFAAVLITVLLVTIVGAVTGWLHGNANYIRYAIIVTNIQLLLCAGSLIFGIIAKLYGQPGFLYSSFLLGGIIGIIVTSGMKSGLKMEMEFDKKHEDLTRESDKKEGKF